MNGEGKIKDKPTVTVTLCNCKNRPILKLISWSHLIMTMSRNWRSLIQNYCILENNAWEKGWKINKKNKWIQVLCTMKCLQAIRKSIDFRVKLQCCFCKPHLKNICNRGRWTPSLGWMHGVLFFSLLLLYAHCLKSFIPGFKFNFNINTSCAILSCLV